jgi:predicted phosphodiesterase
VRAAVFGDVHGNLPALRAALAAIGREGCDVVYHLGDAIAIGPYPAECLDLLLSAPKMRLIMGNHDAWFAHGLPRPQPSWMSDGEVAHQHWVHAQLDPALKLAVASWPYVLEEDWGGLRVTLLHYEPADSASGFTPHHPTYDPADLDRVFKAHGSELVFYGHTHIASDVSGRRRYVNPGSLGCDRDPVAQFVVLECLKGGCTLHAHAVPYDDRPLFEAFERRQVPERAFLYQAFFGGRYRASDEQ